MNTRNVRLAVWAFAMAWSAGANPSMAAEAAAPVAAPPAAPAPVLTMALTGDSIITQRLSTRKEPEFLRMIDLIRGADVAFTNIEMLFHNFEGYPGVVSGGTYMRADPLMAKELAWAGFDLGSRANNHAGDYTHEALFATDRALDAAGIVYAGTGANLQEAREARYYESGAGRVALVSCASTFTPQSVAGMQRSDLQGRPGVNPLRFDTVYYVDQATVDQLRALATRLNGGVARGGRGSGASTKSGGTTKSGRARSGGGDPSAEVVFQGNRYVASDKFATVRTPNEEDLAAISASVKDAQTMADYIIVNIHCHEATIGGVKDSPPDFLVTFAHTMIDHGASVVTAEGPHVLHGIEIYKGKPIFYSLGNFIFENETVLRQPTENYAQYGLALDARVSDFNNARSSNDTRGWPAQREYWESIVALPKFQGDKLLEIKLYPLTLGFGRPAGRRGSPVLADRALSDKVIGDLQRMSEPLGTKIENREGIGFVLLSN